VTKQKTYRNRAYLDWVKTLPCCHCLLPADDPHHIKTKGVGGEALSAPDFTAMPLCREHHNMVHAAPDDWPQARWMIETLNRAFSEGILK